jgi:hypothetical protein
LWGESSKTKMWIKTKWINEAWWQCSSIHEIVDSIFTFCVVYIPGLFILLSDYKNEKYYKYVKKFIIMCNWKINLHSGESGSRLFLIKSSPKITWRKMRSTTNRKFPKRCFVVRMDKRFLYKICASIII